jgi:hypothetical protein
MPERCDRACSTPVPYSVRPGLKSRSENLQPRQDFRGFPLSLQENARTVPQTRPRSLSSAAFPI